MSSSFNLPNQKGTELWPQETALPANVRFVAFDESGSEQRDFLREYGGRIRQFHQAQAQNYALTDSADARRSINLDDRFRVTYSNLMGMETITVEKTLPPKPKPSKEEEEEQPLYDNDPYVFIGMRRIVGGDVDIGGYPNGNIVMVVYQKDTDNLFHDFFSEDNPDEMPSLKPCLYDESTNDIFYYLPDDLGNGGYMRYDGVDPADSVPWDYAFIWDYRDKSGFLDIIGKGEPAERNKMRNRGPQGPYYVKCSFDRQHCDKVPTTVEYIVVLGRGPNRTVTRGSFGIDHGTNIDFLLTPGGYYSDEELQNTDVQYFPTANGECRDELLDNGANPHWKNWWQGALVVTPTPFLEKQVNRTNAGGVSEVAGIGVSWGFTGGAPVVAEDYTNLCEPCDPHPIQYYSQPVGATYRGNYPYDMSDLFPRCFEDANGLAGPPTRYMVYASASFNINTSIKTSLVNPLWAEQSFGMGAYLSNNEITLEELEALVPATLKAYSQGGTEATYPGVDIPTDYDSGGAPTSWSWDGGSQALPGAGGIVAAKDIPECSPLIGGYRWRFEDATIFAETVYPVEFASRGYIFADQYNTYIFLFPETGLSFIESPFTLITATNNSAYLNTVAETYYVFLRMDYKNKTFTVFKSLAEFQAAYAADDADPNVVFIP